MADLLKYRYVGQRDASGLPMLYLTHPLHGGIPARDLTESDLAGLHPDQVAYLELSPIYERVTQAEARSANREAPAAEPNRSSPGLPDEQLMQTAPPGSDAAGPTGEVPAGPPTDAEAQIAAEQDAAAGNPAIQDNPPVVRRGRK